MKHAVVERHDQWSNGTMGIHMPTGRNAAAGRQGHIMHKNIYNSFVLGSMAMEFYGDICSYMKDILSKGFIKWINGLMGNAKTI
jgi:hypothetical protein